VETGGGGTAGAQPAITPLSVTKMNRAAPVCPWPSLTTKSLDPLNTTPVGVSPGIDTTSDDLLPSPSYNVDTPLPLSATQSKPPVRSNTGNRAGARA